MHRAKDFLHHTAEYILKFTKEHGDERSIDERKVAYISELSEDFNEICECLERIEKLYGHKYKHDHAPESMRGYTYDHTPEHKYAHIEDELDGAEKYCELWLKTKDSMYKALAKEELKHAQILIDKVKTAPITDSDKLAELQARADALQHKLQ